MEIEKTMTVAAPIERVWTLLLDPKIMAGCVPGTQSVTEISDVEYLAEIKVKISFIVARFKIKTRILETRPPNYLRCEGTGEDSTVASSMKQTSELFLTDLGASGTEIRIKSKADVLGRLGSFGLSIMTTKADRMWEEFGANFAAIAEQGQPPETVAPAEPAPTPGDGNLAHSSDRVAMTGSVPARTSTEATIAKHVQDAKPPKGGWWRRITGPVQSGKSSADVERLPTDIYVELQHGDKTIKVLWPSSAAGDCAKWLKDELTRFKSAKW